MFQIRNDEPAGSFSRYNLSIRTRTCRNEHPLTTQPKATELRVTCPSGHFGRPLPSPSLYGDGDGYVYVSPPGTIIRLVKDHILLHFYIQMFGVTARSG